MTAEQFNELLNTSYAEKNWQRIAEHNRAVVDRQQEIIQQLRAKVEMQIQVATCYQKLYFDAQDKLDQIKQLTAPTKFN